MVLVGWALPDACHKVVQHNMRVLFASHVELHMGNLARVQPLHFECEALLCVAAAIAQHL